MTEIHTEFIACATCNFRAATIENILDVTVEMNQLCNIPGLLIYSGNIDRVAGKTSSYTAGITRSSKVFSSAASLEAVW